MKESRRETPISNEELAEFNDGLQILESSSASAVLLDAFKALPPRWQRVLWLSEIEGVARAKIAAEPGIKPNAVSALLRRAKAGLRSEWLFHKIPVAIRDDDKHVAKDIPAELLGKSLTIETDFYRNHLKHCTLCYDLRRDLKEQKSKFSKTSITGVGFAALAVTLHTSTPLGLTAAGTATAIGSFTAATMVGTAAASVVAIVVGGVIVSNVMLQPTHESEKSSDAEASSSESGELKRDLAQEESSPEKSVVADPPSKTAVDEGTRQEQPKSEEVQVGRNNPEDTIVDIDLDFDFDRITPQKEKPSSPKPVEKDPVLPPEVATDDFLVSGIKFFNDNDGYLAPVVAGVASAGDEVAIVFEDQIYTAPIAQDQSWSFDFRGLAVTPGLHQFGVFATDGDESGNMIQGEFKIEQLVVDGFEGINWLDITEANSTGIVFSLVGAPSGSVCLISDSGQSAEISLDDEGKTAKRLRFLTSTFYTITISTCAEGYTGPQFEHSLFVDDPNILWSPWGDESEPEFVLSEL